VLLNLCVNARDAMPDGGQLTIKAENVMEPSELAGLLGTAKPTAHVRISVCDTGTGIAPEIREKIFDPFFTTKAPGKGTGLGLSTSLAIVKNHGGFITINSAPGQGSVFNVYLPALASAATTPAQTEHVQIPRGHGELVLVVDDEASVRMIMAQTLQTFGYRTVTANDGAEALAIYQQRAAEIAVVLVDLMMPVMDGKTTIGNLAKLNPQLKVIAASGMDSESGLTDSTCGCVKAFLPKPYTAGTLLKTLREILSEGGETRGDVVGVATGTADGGSAS
jgi:CheY-like chemotaxis protein